jgi:heptosyltransferase-3
MAFSSKIDATRRRITQWMMRLVFRQSGGLTQIAARLPRAGIHRILVCRTVHMLGDSLLLTPLLEELSAVYPGAEIDIICGYAVAREIYGGFFSVGKIIQLPAHALRYPLRTLGALRQMKRTHYDLVIDPDPQSQSGRLLTLLARKTYSLGFVGPKKSGKMTHGVVVPGEPRHKAKIPVFLLRSALGETILKDAYPPLCIALTTFECRQGREMLASMTKVSCGSRVKKGRIGIFANATDGKRLGIDWWTKFLEVFEPGTVDFDLIEILPAFGHSLLDCRYAGYFSSNVRKMASVIANLSLFISADCGVMHLACASGAPTVGVFTVTDASEWGPYGDSNCAIDHRDLTPAQVAVQVLGLLNMWAMPKKLSVHCIDRSGHRSNGVAHGAEVLECGETSSVVSVAHENFAEPLEPIMGRFNHPDPRLLFGIPPLSCFHSPYARFTRGAR